jgi:hypothetical protein
MTDDLPKVKSIKAILEGDDNFYAMMRTKPLLDRLEWAAFKMCQRGHHEDFASDVMTEAKARIEALEAALRSIAANTCCDKCQEAAFVACAALGEKKDD